MVGVGDCPHYLREEVLLEMFELLKKWWGTTQLRHDIRAILDSYKDDGDCDGEGHCPKEGKPCEQPKKSSDLSSA